MNQKNQKPQKSQWDLVNQYLLTPQGLTLESIESALGAIYTRSMDFADFYFQYEVSESWSLEESLVKSGSFSLSQGVGVRVIQGEKTGFAYADSLDLVALNRAAHAARGIVKSGESKKFKIQNNFKTQNYYLAQNPLGSISSEEKVSLLQKIDQFARQRDPRIREVMASLSANFEVILMMATDGTLAYDVRPLVRLNITVVAEGPNGQKEQGFSGGGARKNYEMFLDNNYWEKITLEACEVALVNLHAQEAPAGNLDIVLGNGWPGVLLHEAFGHGLEGDFNRKKTSTFHDLMGKQVASSICTIVDDGTVHGARGSLNIDDEGTPTQCTTLVENGILKNYLQDKHNARLMGGKSTGNGRRESYADLVMPRMTNTYLLPGKHTPEEIIGSVDRGIYAKNFSGGAVDITTGKFVFVTNEAFLIEKGRITHPVKGATLIGDGPSALLKVTMVGNDLALDAGVGVCGKDGQSVPVGVGQPTLRINGLTVGGTGDQ